MHTITLAVTANTRKAKVQYLDYHWLVSIDHISRRFPKQPRRHNT